MTQGRNSCEYQELLISYEYATIALF